MSLIEDLIFTMVHSKVVENPRDSSAENTVGSNEELHRLGVSCLIRTPMSQFIIRQFVRLRPE